MKTILALTLFCVAGATVALAQYGQALKRANQVVNENNVRQGVPSPAQNHPAPAAPVAATNTVTQAQTLTALKSDLAGFKTGVLATAAQKQQFTLTLAKAARANKPSLGTVKKFVDSLSIGLSGASLTDEQRQRLALNIDAVLNSRSIAAPQFDKIIADTEAILRVGSVKGQAATSIAADLKAIGTEVRR